MNAPVPPLHDLALSSIAHRCRQESVRYFQRQPNDPTFCYELFRRAFVERSDHAWEFIYTQYTPLVFSWVEHHGSFPGSGEEAAYFVNRALEKLWSAMSPDKFADFPDLKSVLAYLQLCVHSVVVDHVRKAAWPTEEAPEAGDAGLEKQVLGDLSRAEFWRLVRACLNDEREVNLVYYRYVLGLKPRHICERFPDEFPDVQEIFRMTQNIMARWRRDPNLRNFFDDLED
ncbi:MAG: hypothetical protein R3C14_45595 [Caldilineaceae bacterium]